MLTDLDNIPFEELIGELSVGDEIKIPSLNVTCVVFDIIRNEIIITNTGRAIT